MPRGGGVGIVCGTFVSLGLGLYWCSSWQLAAVLVPSIALGLLGLLDDVTQRLSARSRLATQLLVGLASSLFVFLHGSRNTAVSMALVVLGVFWVAGFVNAYNFMDGINGISGTQAVASGLALSLVAVHENLLWMEVGALAIAAGSLGFLPFNFPRPVVFPGDVGSYFIGGWLGLLAVTGCAAGVPVEAVLGPFALYVADTSWTLLKRMLRREQWDAPHRDHTYQQLVDLGWSHAQVTSLVVMLTVISSALGAVSLFEYPTTRIAADVGVLVILAAYLALPSLLSGRQLRQAQ